LIAFVCLYFFFVNIELFFILSLLVGLIVIYEIGGALRHIKIDVNLAGLYLVTASLFLSYWFYWDGMTHYAILVLGFTVLSLVAISIRRKTAVQKVITWHLLSILWICCPLFVLISIRFSISSALGSRLIFFIVLVAAVNDVFAYFGGKRFGKHPLAPRISPKKTVEGSLFGLLGAQLAGFGMASYYLKGFLPVWKLFFLILLLTIASQLGDLLESKFKRFCGVKDSSNLIPGHGGVLDRVDAYLLALPVFYILVHTFG
jgi:phosphatidate cytidylyltransferase